jgi:hypothetical protein
MSFRPPLHCRWAAEPQPAALRSRVPAQVDRREPHMHSERERRASEYARIHSARFWPAASLSSRPTGQAARHHPWRGARARGPDLCRCVRVWRARGAGASPARAGDKVPDEAASCGSVRIGPGPRAQPQVGGRDGKREEVPRFRLPRWRGVAWRYPPIRRDTIPCHASPAWHEYTTGGSGYPILGPGVRTVVHARRHAVRHDADV